MNPNDPNHLQELVQALRYVFTPTMLDHVEQLKQGTVRWAHYTNASTARQIILNKQFWLRNVRCMNDYSEVLHGRNCLSSAWRCESTSKFFKETLEGLHPGIVPLIETGFDRRLTNLILHTYIACFSEHDPIKDKMGRLSMWRAYGHSAPVAVIIDPRLAFEPSTAIPTCPAIYCSDSSFRRQFFEMSERFKERIDVFKCFSIEKLQLLIELSLAIYCQSLKHPGFEEEREWRFIYSPESPQAEFLKQRIVGSIEEVNQVPQTIHKVILTNSLDDNILGLPATDFIEGILIGPNEDPYILRDAFVNLLGDLGHDDAENRVTVSNIPYRHQ